MVSVSADRVSVVERGFDPRALRERAVGECERVLGPKQGWQLTQAEIVPCMVSLGGRVRLYEARFVASRA